VSDSTRAYQTQWQGHICIVLATTPAQAKAATFRSARDASFNIQWTDIRCKRARQYDVLLLSAVRRMTPLTPEVADQIKAQYR